MKVMKKLGVSFAVLLMGALCLGLMFGCGPSNEEIIRKGVTEEFDSIKNLDESALSEITGGIDPADLAEFGLDANQFMRAYLEGFDYRIDDVKVNGDTAQVTVVLTCKSFSDYETALEEAAGLIASDDSLAGLDEAALSAHIGQVLMGVVDSLQPKESEPLVLEYNLVDRTWQPSATATRNIEKALFA